LLQMDFISSPWLECICTRQCTWLFHAAANVDMVHKKSTDRTGTEIQQAFQAPNPVCPSSCCCGCKHWKLDGTSAGATDQCKKQQQQ
jgi:hypothetical protein